VQESTQYAYQKADGSYVYSGTPLTVDGVNITGQVDAQTNTTTHVTVLYEGGLQAFNNTYLPYLNPNDIKPLAYQYFTQTQAETEVMVLEHEMTHVALASGNTPSEEGVANYWGSQAANAYKGATGQ